MGGLERKFELTLYSLGLDLRTRAAPGVDGSILERRSESCDASGNVCLHEQERAYIASCVSGKQSSPAAINQLYPAQGKCSLQKLFKSELSAPSTHTTREN